MRFYEADNFDPRPNDAEHVNWHAKRLGESALRPLRFTQGDYDVQITPVTGGTVLNQMCDEMDAVWVLDIRDNTRWVIFRDEVNSDNFKLILEGVAAHGAVQYTFEPTQDFEDLYCNRQFRDVAKADTFPQNWTA